MLVCNDESPGRAQSAPERIADHRQSHRAEPLTRQCAELKGQGANLAPRFDASAESSRQRARHQDRDRKCAVVAITSCNRSSNALLIDPARRPSEIIFRAAHCLRISLVSSAAPNAAQQCGRAQIASLCPCHPSLHRGSRDATASRGHEKSAASRRFLQKHNDDESPSANSRSRGEGAARKLACPASGGCRSSSNALVVFANAAVNASVVTSLRAPRPATRRRRIRNRCIHRPSGHKAPWFVQSVSIKSRQSSRSLERDLQDCERMQGSCRGEQIGHRRSRRGDKAALRMMLGPEPIAHRTVDRNRHVPQ